MITSYHRPSVIKIDLGAIKKNIKNEINRLKPEQELYAVVKANAYGHGVIEVSKVAIESGATGLCVSNLDEALEIREAGIKEPVLVLSYVGIDYLDLAITHDIILTAPSLDWLKKAADMLEKKDASDELKVHLKIDTGMGRLGLRTEHDWRAALPYLTNNRGLIVDGIFTHFATADMSDTSYFETQQARFIQALNILGKDNVTYIHTANSATALWHDGWESNLIRFGDAMYGLNPSGRELELPYPLVQALSLETEIIHIKELEPGESIGYGATYETTTEEWIGTLPIGYADGISRRYQGFHVLIEGERVPIVGRVCMDQCMVHLPRYYPVGTRVTIFGENSGCFNTIQSAADYVGTINYEVTCDLSDRLPRMYHK